MAGIKRRRPSLRRQLLYVKLPHDRDFSGTLAFLDEDGSCLAGPFPVCGRSGDQLAAEHGNASRTATLPYGDTPIGTYRVAGFISTGTGTKYRRDLFGAYGAIVLRARDGDAALAEANGRFEILIHGGPLSRDGRLRATSGNMRIADSHLKALAKVIGKTEGLICECVGTAGSSDAIAAESECSLDLPILDSTIESWITPNRSVVTAGLVAQGEYSADFTAPDSGSEPSTAKIPYEPPPPPPQPTMRPSETPWSEGPDVPEHDLEDERTKRMSEEGSNEETPDVL